MDKSEGEAATDKSEGEPPCAKKRKVPSQSDDNPATIYYHSCIRMRGVEVDSDGKKWLRLRIYDDLHKAWHLAVTLDLDQVTEFVREKKPEGLPCLCDTDQSVSLEGLSVDSDGTKWLQLCFNNVMHLNWQLAARVNVQQMMEYVRLYDAEKHKEEHI